MTPLILSAVPFEVAPTIHALALKHIAFDYQDVGIGPFSPERGLSQLPIQAQGRDVVFIGTCGVFGAFVEPRLVLAIEAHWLPTCERHQLSYQAAQPLPPLRWRVPDIDAEAPIEKCSAICAPNVSLSDKLPDKYQQSSLLLVETIELYRVARMVLPVAKSFRVLLGITNAVGPLAREQWLSHHSKCAKMSSDFVIESWTSSAGLGQ